MRSGWGASPPTNPSSPGWSAVAGHDIERLHSHSLRPVARIFERFSGFEQALQACKDNRPTTRYGFDEFRAALVDFMRYGEFDGIAAVFELEHRARITFRAHLRHHLIAPGQHQPPRRVDLHDLTAVCDAAVGRRQL